MNEVVSTPQLFIPPYFDVENLVKSKHETVCLNRFSIQNRRFLGNKYKLLNFIEKIVNRECEGYKTFCDIFAGTGVVGARFNKNDVKIISNDLLYSNYIALKAFLGIRKIDTESIKEKISYLNSKTTKEENYFSINFGNTYFTIENARKIGLIREEIDKIADSDDEKAILITSLIYATDKVANTVGHYDAFRGKLDALKNIQLSMPIIPMEDNKENKIYNKDANTLIKEIECDVLYMDPPYNSRQYGDAYHLLENLAVWNKPEVVGKAKKMNRSHIKSKYCLKAASEAFRELIGDAKCKHILVSYNNTGASKDGRSNARITDKEMVEILESKGKVKVFKEAYKAFTTGRSTSNNHEERIFYCKVS